MISRLQSVLRYAVLRRMTAPLLAAAFTCLLTTTLMANASVQAVLSADTIPVGGYTQLTLQVNGSNRADVDLPNVDGIILRNSGTSQSTSIVNGQVTRSATIRITVLGERQGTFTIPPIPVTVNDEVIETRPLTLRVDDNLAQSNPNARASQQNPSDSLTAEDIRRIARVEIEVPSHTVYIGQSVPLQVELWVNTAHRFDNLAAPSVRTEAILMESLGQDFQRTIEYEGNERFEVYRWSSEFSPIEPGNLSLQFATEVSLLVRARRATSAFDSIFDSDFFSPSHRRIPLLIQSQPLEMEVRKLPSGAPHSFTGAIGNFTLKSTASPLEVEQGDPITLDIVISGEGNFDRVNHSGLQNPKGFRTYQPEEQWEPDSTNPRRGRKNFKQAIIPSDPGITEIPPVSFSYFNPERAEYETLQTEPITISVSGTAQSATESPRERQQAGSGLIRIESDGWIPLQLELDPAAASLRPISMNKAVWLLPMGGPVVLLALCWVLPFWIQNQRQNRENRFNELKRTLRSIDKSLATAKQDQQAGVYVQAATRKTRLMLGTLWRISPDSITSADAKARLGEQFPAIRKILELHNAMQYAGGVAPSVDIDATAEALESEWKQLLNSLEQS